jgi:hypothetical protein
VLERELFATGLLGAQATLRRGALELPGLAWLHVMTATTEILKDSRALHLLLEDSQRRFDTVAFAKLYFDHSNQLLEEKSISESDLRNRFQKPLREIDLGNRVYQP